MVRGYGPSVFDLDRWRDRWRALDAALRVTERFGAVGGGPLSASITLATFLSLFPLLLVAIAVIGFWASGDTTLAQRLVGDLGLRGKAADTVLQAIEAAEDSRRAASVIGLVGLLWSGLGVVGALQAALNAVWQAKGGGLVAKAFALLWLLGAGGLFLLTAALGALVGFVPGPAMPLTVGLSLALTTVLFVWTYTVLCAKDIGWRDHLPGAVLVALGAEALKAVSSVYVPRVIASSSALYGSIGVVFAVLAILAIYSRLIVYGAALNVVRYEGREGTVSVQIDVPRVDGEVPLTATRGGAVDEQGDADAVGST